MILAFRNKSAEKDNPDDMSLAGDGFDTVIRAKAAVDRVAGCRNKVSCADILAMATRDVISLVNRVYSLFFVSLHHSFPLTFGDCLTYGILVLI